MSEEKCKFCDSTELVYHQYVICDSSCQECGEWQNGDYLENQSLLSTGSPFFHHKKQMRKLIWQLYNENRISEEIVHVLLDKLEE